MSRHVRHSEDRRYEVAYGKDRTCGFFLQVFDNIDPKTETLLVDLDQAPWTAKKADPTTFPGIAAKYGVTLTVADLVNA